MGVRVVLRRMHAEREARLLQCTLPINGFHWEVLMCNDANWQGSTDCLPAVSIMAIERFPFFFSLDGKETKDQALPARRPLTALLAKTAEIISLEQPPFWSLPSA